MANYIYLFRGGDRRDWSPQQMQQSMEKWKDWIAALSKSGNFKAGDPLEEGGKVLRGKKKVVTDGPYAETKDLVGGYLVISAGSLDEATELARGCPILEGDGLVEVRAVRAM